MLKANAGFKKVIKFFEANGHLSTKKYAHFFSKIILAQKDKIFLDSLNSNIIYHSYRIYYKHRYA